MDFTFAAKAEPECKDFLRIGEPSGEYKTIDSAVSVMGLCTKTFAFTCRKLYNSIKDERLYP